jgi:ABC-type phosphate/phosphonate transport system substrate-binding protein
MGRDARAVVLALCGTVLCGVTGCQTAGLRLLSFVGLQKQPVVLALVLDNRPVAAAAEVFNPFPKYFGLQQALAKDLGRPVSLDACFPFQVQSGLASGWYHLAVLTPAQLARIAPLATGCRVLAVPVDRQERAVRPALLVVPANSAIRSIGELRGKIVAFGPAEDSRAYHAALQLLREAGLEKRDLALEALPVPGAVKHLPDGRGIAQSVINGSSEAGFVDAAAWDELAEHATQPGDPARDQLRVIGRTLALPDWVMVLSPKVGAPLSSDIEQALLATGQRHPEALLPLASTGLVAPDAAALDACRALVILDELPRVLDSQPTSRP